MKTFKLWLEPDREIPRFKRLAFEEVDVPIVDVIQRGIHPWQGSNVHPRLKVKFVDLLNSDDVISPELDEMGYCGGVNCEESRYINFANQYQNNRSISLFEKTLDKVRDSVYFVDGLTYGELLQIAKERLRTAWSHRIAHALLNRTHQSFDAIRTFLKSKDKSIKLSGYADIDDLDLARILRLEDFESEDTILISVGLPIQNFRSKTFLSKVTDERGLLRMAEKIPHFQLALSVPTQFGLLSILYNCKAKGTDIRFAPELDTNQEKRSHAREFAERWRTDQGRYCFTTSMERLAAMIGMKDCDIRFSSLSYREDDAGKASRASIKKSRPPVFAVRGILKSSVSGDVIKSVLRDHGVSMTGRKTQLIEKLAKLAAAQYEKHLPALDVYFREHRFLRITNAAFTDNKQFPLLDGHQLRNTVLTMYILKHSRGNTILEAKHDNDTFDLLSLAKSLIDGEVSVSDGFMQVQ